MKTLDEKTENILIAFCLHEKLVYPKVKKIFLRQLAFQQMADLRQMEIVIKRGIMPAEIDKGIKVDQDEALGSARNGEIKKDD